MSLLALEVMYGGNMLGRRKIKDYSYIFHDTDAVIVQSSLTFCNK